jgi:hypothetical protein
LIKKNFNTRVIFKTRRMKFQNKKLMMWNSWIKWYLMQRLQASEKNNWIKRKETGKCSKSKKRKRTSWWKSRGSKKLNSYRKSKKERSKKHLEENKW